jgi:hypothetical protein
MPGIAALPRLVNRNDDAVRAVYVNGRLAWDGRDRGPGFGAEPGFGRVLRGSC